MIWPKAVGVDAAILGLSFLKYSAPNATLIVDPFCGYGTILAAANYFKLNSFGIDLSLKRCKKAVSRSLHEEIESVPIVRRKLLGARGDEVAVYVPYRAKSRTLGARAIEDTDWKESVDETTQQLFWLNAKTSERTFVRPLSLLRSDNGDSGEGDDDGNGDENENEDDMEHDPISDSLGL